MISQPEKTNPISEMPKMNVNLYVIEVYENEPPSGSKKTNPIQSQFQTAYLLIDRTKRILYYDIK